MLNIWSNVGTFKALETLRDGIDVYGLWDENESLGPGTWLSFLGEEWNDF